MVFGVLFYTLSICAFLNEDEIFSILSTVYPFTTLSFVWEEKEPSGLLRAHCGKLARI